MNFIKKLEDSVSKSAVLCCCQILLKKIFLYYNDITTNLLNKKHRRNLLAFGMCAMYTRKCEMILRSLLSTHLFTGVSNVQSICTTPSLRDANYYEALGIAPSSTQNEIKSAYYKLSMQFHPDKNKGCEISAKKFRDITRAYEVLGNYRLRRLYDKGVIHTAGPTYAQPTDYEPEVEDDPETKFYKSRFKKSKVSDELGRTPIYDFDEWSRAHYGKSFQRRQDSKAKFDRKQKEKRDHVFALQKEFMLFGFVFVVMGMYTIFYTESSLDTPKGHAIAAIKDNNDNDEN